MGAPPKGTLAFTVLPLVFVLATSEPTLTGLPPAGPTETPAGTGTALWGHLAQGRRRHWSACGRVAGPRIPSCPWRARAEVLTRLTACGLRSCKDCFTVLEKYTLQIWGPQLQPFRGLRGAAASEYRTVWGGCIKYSWVRRLLKKCFSFFFSKKGNPNGHVSGWPCVSTCVHRGGRGRHAEGQRGVLRQGPRRPRGDGQGPEAAAASCQRACAGRSALVPGCSRGHLPCPVCSGGVGAAHNAHGLGAGGRWGRGGRGQEQKVLEVRSLRGTETCPLSQNSRGTALVSVRSQSLLSLRRLRAESRGPCGPGRRCVCGAGCLAQGAQGPGCAGHTRSRWSAGRAAHCRSGGPRTSGSRAAGRTGRGSP